MPDSDITWMVLRAQAGDRSAWRPLVNALARILRPYLIRLMGSAAAGEDALQDVLMIVYRKLGGLSDPALLRPWAFRIASRHAFKLLRKHRREREALAEFEREPADTEQATGDDVAADAVLALLPELSPASGAVLALHYGEGLSLESVAAVLGAPLGTVKSRLAYGLKLIRDRLAHAQQS